MEAEPDGGGAVVSRRAYQYPGGPFVTVWHPGEGSEA